MSQSKQSDSGGKIGAVRAWALAAGGMVGGGIYVSLGVVIQAAGPWAWLSFVIAGIAAVITAWNYARLSNHYGKSGGAFQFLEEMKRKQTAGSLSWLLIIGYTLTISVYAFAFGQYVANAFDGGPWMIRGLAVGIAALMIGLNLLGAGKLTSVEVVIVSTNLLALIALAAIGIAGWDPSQLHSGVADKPVHSALIGAAAIFVAYEGFQLLAYEYEELDHPKRMFVPVMLSASIFVVLIYVAVTLGATMVAGAGAIVASKQTALADAASAAIGTPGLIGMTVAAAFATSAAINSTLFSTAKLCERVSRDDELPKWLGKENRNDIPYRAVIGIGTISAVLAVTGSLSSLVEAASLVFVTAFGIVNVLAADKIGTSRWISGAGAALCGVLGVTLIYRLATSTPIPLAILVVMVLVAVFVRPFILRHC